MSSTRTRVRIREGEKITSEFKGKYVEKCIIKNSAAKICPWSVCVQLCQWTAKNIFSSYWWRCTSVYDLHIFDFVDVHLHILKYIISLAANLGDNRSKDTWDRRLTLYAWFCQITGWIRVFLLAKLLFYNSLEIWITETVPGRKK